MKYCLLALLALAATMNVFGQASPAPDTGPIQDNSFLLEEAYNQESGVVQHINTFTRLWGSNQWVYTFTQEWPVPNHWRNQLSYTITGTNPDPDMGRGFGDVLLNYRYQAVGTGDTRLAVAPRLSMILPTGSWRQKAGYGGPGVQANVPASVALSRRLVAHSNLGGTWIPRAHDTSGDTAASYGYSAGQSLIWLARSRFNVMLESAWGSSHVVSGPSATETQNAFWIVPGVRWAHNFKSGLQIVPGVAYVAGAGPSQGQNGVFLYLSFEHPMWRDKEGSH
jgi:hypothetical protein